MILCNLGTVKYAPTLRFGAPAPRCTPPSTPSKGPRKLGTNSQISLKLTPYINPI